jgi:hypothetical protein
VTAARHPDRLYKYMSMSGDGRLRAERLLCHREIWFAAPGQLNDPYDCRPLLSFESTGAERDAWLERTQAPGDGDRAARRTRLEADLADEAWRAERTARFQERIRTETGVLGLSLAPDLLSMWTYYAGGHSGLCVQLETGRERLARLDPPVIPLPVEYEPVVPTIHFFGMESDELVRTALGRKSLEFEHEREFRLVREAGPGLVQLPEGSVSGVVMGSRMDAETVAEIERWIAEAGVAVRIGRARQRADAFGVEIDWDD